MFGANGNIKHYSFNALGAGDEAREGGAPRPDDDGPYRFNALGAGDEAREDG